MSKRVYLLKNLCQTTQEEKTPVSIRIQASNATVKALQTRLQDAYRRDDVRLVRRTSVLLDLLTQTATVPVLCERWGLSPACLYAWQKAFLLHGLDSLRYRHSGGRPEKLTPTNLAKTSLPSVGTEDDRRYPGPCLGFWPVERPSFCYDVLHYVVI